MILFFCFPHTSTQCTFKMSQAAKSAIKTVQQPQENRQSEQSKDQILQFYTLG